MNAWLIYNMSAQFVFGEEGPASGNAYFCNESWIHSNRSSTDSCKNIDSTWLLLVKKVQA